MSLLRQFDQAPILQGPRNLATLNPTSLSDYGSLLVPRGVHFGNFNLML